MNQIVIICNRNRRDHLRLILQDNQEIHIIAYVSDGLEALKICSQTGIDLVLMVLTNDFEPVNWIGVFQAKYPHIKVLIMVEAIMDDILFTALRNGAAGYILFTDNCAKIVDAINLCLLGFVTMEQLCMKSLIPYGTDKSHN